MQETQILSTRPQPLPETPSDGLGRRVLVFDACHVGVVLRSVLFVETVLAVGAMFGAESPLAWLARLSLLTGGALPATLAWLVTACSLKTVLQRRSVALQCTAGVLLGALAGLHACGMLVLVGVPDEAPWLASAASGALLSAVLVAALLLRARARTPAATTARLSELQSRIRPHFLFNTLNSAIALVRDEPARAEALLEDLSDLFRHALVEQGESATLDEEIALARRYLAIEEVRFGERLRVQWVIDPRTGGAQLPPLLLQPLVENAIRHGLEPQVEGGRIAVAARTLAGTPGRLELTVIDTGAGLGRNPAQAGSRFGLAQVRERLATLQGSAAVLELGPGDAGRGTRVRIVLPLTGRAPAPSAPASSLPPHTPPPCHPPAP